MADALTAIMARKREEVAVRQAQRPLAEVDDAARATPTPRGFAAAVSAPDLSLIAEIKHASPSRGIIRPDFDPPAHARAYAEGGASCLSVLTDGPGFGGADEHLQAARAATPLPILRKDFMWDPYQIAEARALGADAILLILAVLDDARARDLLAAAADYGLDVLTEVHDRDELDRAAGLGARLIGVNNRDLRTFTTELTTFETLAPHAPSGAVLVAESGVSTPADAARMAQAGARAILVGESLMRQADLTAAARALMGFTVHAPRTT